MGLISEYFPPYAFGGAEWSAYQLGQALAARGHHVVVITPNFGDAPTRVVDGGVHIHRVPFPIRIRGRQPLKTRWLANPLFYLYLAWHVHRIARQEHLEVLHAQNRNALPATVLAGRALRIRTVFTLRDYLSLCPVASCLMEHEEVPHECSWPVYLRHAMEYYYQTGGRRDIWSRIKHLLIVVLWERLDLALRWWCLERVDRIVTVSQAVQRIYSGVGAPAERMVTVYNLPPGQPTGADPVELRARYGLDGQRVVLVVGKLSLGKGTSVLLEAVPQVLALVPNTVFVLVGRPGAFRDRAVAYGDRVRLLNHLPNAEVMALYRVADVVALPSVWQEPFSRVLLEAMTASKPVVASHCGGNPEAVVDGVTGFLVPPREPQALAEAIVRVLSDADLARRMGQAGYSLLAERFRAEASLEKLLAVYTGTL